MSGSPVAIVFEPHVGGRIFERDAQGTEIPWGEILAVGAAHRIEYLWHLFFPPAEATRVAVTFTPSAGGTTVRIVQTGWDALAEPASAAAKETSAGWAIASEHYRAFVDEQREEAP